MMIRKVTQNMKRRRMWILPLFVVLAIVTSIGATAVIARPVLGDQSTSPSPIQHTASKTLTTRARTVLGQGPELHLLPNFGPVGTRVSVVGLGFRPGAHVNIAYGSPNAEFMPQPIAAGTASMTGRFHTTFTVTCAFVVVGSTQALHPPRHCPLSSSNPFRAVIVGAIPDDHRSFRRRTETLGFIVKG